MSQNNPKVMTGLFAITYCNRISHGQNPSTVIYNQAAMRPHLVKCSEQGKIELFPITWTKRAESSIKIII